jgi:hypothetical protein
MSFSWSAGLYRVWIRRKRLDVLALLVMTPEAA